MEDDNSIDPQAAFALDQMAKLNKNLKRSNKNLRALGIMTTVGLIAHAIVLRSGMPLRP